jgi:hypothetical protein
MRIALIAASLAAGLAQAAERAEEFAYRAPLELAMGQAIYQLELPLAVHQGAHRPDLGDLRVFNGAGEVVPHALRAVTVEPQEEPARDLTIFPYRASPGASATEAGADVKIELRPGGAVAIDVRRGTVMAPPDPQLTAYFFDAGTADKALKAIKLDWEPIAGGFSGRADVHASDDLRSWRPLSTGAPLLDLQIAGQRLEVSRIELPRARTRYLRLTWPAGQSMPQLRGARVEIATAAIERARRTIVQEARRGEKDGEYLADLGAPLVVQRMQIELPQQNTVSVIELSARSRPTDPWRPVDRATYYRLMHSGEEWRNAERVVSVPAARYWQLKVDSRGGGLGAGNPRLVVSWEPRLLVFVARGEGPYTLAVGHDRYGPADFRVESLIPGLAEGRPVAVAAATLGTLTSAAPAKPQGPVGEFVDSLSGEQGRRWLLWAILVGGVAVLGVMAWRMARGLGSPERRD